MYTVEQIDDSHVITAMSETTEHEDIQVIVDPDGEVWLRQFNDYNQQYEVIRISFYQLLDIAASINSPEGFFKIEIDHEYK